MKKNDPDNNRRDLPESCGWYPGSLFLAFRKTLGSVNPKIEFVSSLLRDFESDCLGSPDPDNFMRAWLVDHKQGRLFLSSQDIASTTSYVSCAHLSYIHACGDLFIQKITLHPEVAKMPQGENLEGDSLRRLATRLLYSDPATVSVLSGEGRESVCFERLLGRHLAAGMDYYRLVRNQTFHKLNPEVAPLAEETMVWIRLNFGHTPSSSGLFSSSDAILYSKMWQRVAHEVCRKIYTTEEIEPIVRRRFISKGAQRAELGQRFLRAEFLLDEREAKAIVVGMGWLA